MASYSLRRRLVGALLIAVAGTWIVVGAVTYQDAQREISVVLDAHLEQVAALLAVQADHELTEINGEDLGELSPYGQAVAFQVWSAAGAPLVRSSNAPSIRFSPSRSGFEDFSAGARRWRIFSRWSVGQTVFVQVGESLEGRQRLARRFILHALWPVVLGLPLLGLLIWGTVNRALRPFAKLRREIGARQPNQLQALPLDAIPEEVAPLVVHLNALFARIRSTLDAERRFTSHAAHELRTPVAAIRAQAESAVAMPDSAESRHALHQVIVACDRLARVVGQLLTLARIEEVAEPTLQSCLLDEVARRVVADLAPQALAQGIEIELSEAAAVRVGADPVLIDILVRNLVDNAVRYGGAGTTVQVAVAASAAGGRLTVRDDGAGLGGEELAHLGRPFYRGAQSGGGGSGLGLSIVNRIAEHYGGSVTYTHGGSGKGLWIQVQFPA